MSKSAEKTKQKQQKPGRDCSPGATIKPVSCRPFSLSPHWPRDPAPEHRSSTVFQASSAKAKRGAKGQHQGIEVRQNGDFFREENVDVALFPCPRCENAFYSVENLSTKFQISNFEIAESGERKAFNQARNKTK